MPSGCVNAARDVDEREVAELAIGAIEPRGELRGELEDQTGAFRRDLTKARIRHFRDFALRARTHPGAALRLLVEQSHLAEELTLVEVGQYHFVAVFVFDHDFDGTVDDVVEHVG
jgi:hypothetical protein